MHTMTAYEESRLHYWRHVREFAVPPSMIESATARRTAGDWAGACTAARFDVDLDLRATARTYGRELADRIRADLRRLAPDLLRWHLPRIAPDGLLRPGLTVSLASYPGSAVHLVVRTPPAWADAGQRVSLTLWDASRSTAGAGLHPHPHPDRRYRLDLHRHLWDAHRSAELRDRAGADVAAGRLDPAGLVPDGAGCAVGRWASEAAILLRARGLASGTVLVRLAAGRRLALHMGDTHPPHLTAAPARGEAARARRTAAQARGTAVQAGGTATRAGVAATRATQVAGASPDRAAHQATGEAWLILPDAATWVPPDLALLRAGLIDADHLHPLVAAALVPDAPLAGAQRTAAGGPRLVECRGAPHRIGLVDGVLVPLDHDPVDLRREELLVALGGPPMPCLRVIDEVSRRPECLVDVRARLDHGDASGALAVVEDLLGPGAVLRAGALRDELDLAASRQVTHGLYRAALAGFGPTRLREKRQPGQPRSAQERRASDERDRARRSNQRRASSC
ncbi:hypothetical protein Lfu02_70480 [Longispora fulva]|uniref:Uncharacterized protein n=1 Tax=Longispora fulva TaxID=619741 RepID=A0A8J7GDE6_9ACTN|nr:hypothetical protein [Longispora fulva]MBG6134407.1 hypothetical protein [Longispora fulva]GIG62676.1 hypothetical protein Lfu02_70480 [Longispora fulva]